ncbi:MAG TPA: 5-oxoprolinase subunit PxpA [Thermoanaerobaculia bacterium]|nr:5-oxoprolinase subunit PxpA [Thermoanaerobaculia bacterium]
MIELSADLGEAASDEDRAVERAIWSMIDAANVACGGHAGDEASMREGVRNASRLGVILGAHPSYPDRENFGRASMAIDPGALRTSLVSQIGRFREIASGEGLRLQRVKAHGALYNDAHRDRALAGILVEAVRAVDPAVAIVASGKSKTADAAREAGLPVIREAFADRRYRPDGSLVPRNEPDALLSVAEAAAQADMLVRERIVDARGHRITIDFDTICIHADMQGAVARLKAIRQRLAPFVRMTSE